jgi:hypothetical protein
MEDFSSMATSVMSTVVFKIKVLNKTLQNGVRNFFVESEPRYIGLHYWRANASNVAFPCKYPGPQVNILNGQIATQGRGNKVLMNSRSPATLLKSFTVSSKYLTFTDNEVLSPWAVHQSTCNQVVFHRWLLRTSRPKTFQASVSRVV